MMGDGVLSTSIQEYDMSVIHSRLLSLSKYGFLSLDLSRFAVK